MTTEVFINTCVANQSISRAELARRMGMSPSSLHNRIKRQCITLEDMQWIAETLGGEFTYRITFPDGSTVSNEKPAGPKGTAGKEA